MISFCVLTDCVTLAVSQEDKPLLQRSSWISEGSPQIAGGPDHFQRENSFLCQRYFLTTKASFATF